MNHPEKTENVRPPLSFEEFSVWEKFSETRIALYPRYNNFFLFFKEEPPTNVYRHKKIFKRFQEEHPELEKRTTSIITKTLEVPYGHLPETAKKLPAVEKDLYEAYLVMRKYVEDDEELFT